MTQRDTTALLFATVQEQLLALGYARLTIESVAASSGVAKTTIYRRWKSKAEMVFSLMLSSFEGTPFSPPNSNPTTLMDDLRTAVAFTFARLDSPIAREALIGVLADSIHDAELHDRLFAEFMPPARLGAQAIVDRAAARGETLRPDAAVIIHATVLGSLTAWIHLFDEERPTDLIEVIARQCLAAITASPDPPSVPER